MEGNGSTMIAPDRYEVRPSGSCWVVWDQVDDCVFGRAVGSMAAAEMAAELLNGNVDADREEHVLFLVAMVMIESDPAPALALRS